MNKSESTQHGNKKASHVFYGWIIVMASFLAMFVFGTLNVLGVFIEPLTQEFGWSRANISLAFSIYSLMFTLPAFITGRICDKYGIRKVTALGAILTGSSLLLCSQVSSLIQLYALFATMAFGISTAFVPATTTISRWFVKKRATAIGIALTASGFGMFIFSPLTEIFITNFGWRATFLIYGLFAMITMAISGLLFKQDPGEVGLLPYGCGNADSLNIDKTKEIGVGDLVKKKSFWYMYLIMFVTHVSYFMFTVHIVPHAIDLGVSGIAAAAALTFAGIFNIPAKIVAGVIFDRFKGINLLALFLAIHTLSAFTLVISNDMGLIYLTSAIMGFGYGCWTVVLTVTISEFYGTRNLGFIFGFLDSAVGIGGMLGAYLAGYIFDITGAYFLAFSFSALLMVSTLVFSILLRREKPG